MTSILYLISLCLSLQVISNVLDYSSYQNEVLSKNSSMVGLKASIDSYHQKEKESNLVFSPQVFANFFYSQDERETLNPQFMGVTTTVKNYEVGLKQQTPWGQQLSLSYQSQYIGLNGTILTSPLAYEVGPKIELTQSLWKNFFGQESRAQRSFIKSQNAALYYQDLHNYKLLLMQTKMLYFNTYIAKESLRLQLESLKRAQEILTWAQKRSQRQLADESDYLQAQAQVLSKEFEVRVARENLSSVEKKFQSMRGNDHSTLSETLVPLNAEELLSYMAPSEYIPRAEFQAFEEQLNLHISQSVISAHRYKPTFEIFGQMHYQGRDPEYSIADNEAWDRKNEWWVVGLRFMAPIYFLDSSDTIGAYEIQQQVAAKQLEQKKIDEFSAWNNLIEQLEQKKERYKISKKLQAVQKKKIDVERTRLKQGRTTTYQVLMFEIDYLNAELIHLQSMAELVQVTSELDLHKKL